MAQFDQDMFIENLPISTYKELVNALNNDSNWIILANNVAVKLGYERNLWIESLIQSSRGSDTPGEKLLHELNIKMCTVEILCVLLKDCQLLNVLSILSPPEPLRIVYEPIQDNRNGILKRSFGERLLLSCIAVGMPPPNYTWYHNDRLLHRSTSSNVDFIVTSASQAGEYRCEVSQVKLDGTIISILVTQPIHVQISPKPVEIEEQPVPLLEVRDGDTFSISCEASGHPKPDYQWFRDNTKLEGETSNLLRIDKFSAKEEGKYYCCVSNAVSEVYTQRSHIMMDLPRLKAVAKIALIIANVEYEYQESLSTPKNDAAQIGSLLREIGFKVICLLNLTIAQMKSAIKIFSEALSEGVYGLFYFAGHGFKMQESYMLAVDTPKTYLRKDAICESELLSMFLENDPELLVIILDMCQTVPPKEFNPNIHNEVPTVNEYKSRKNLRNLIQAYSTSSHRPSYERADSKYGLYSTHLSKYINKDILVTKVFEEVGKSVDVWFKGMERNQIPMFALTITKPFRLTDAIYNRNPPASINQLNKLISFPTKTLEINFKQAKVFTKVTISPFLEPYLNIIKIKICDIENMEVNFFNSVSTRRNNLYQKKHRREWWIHNPQINEGPLVISISQNGAPIGATLLHIQDYIPKFLKLIGM